MNEDASFAVTMVALFALFAWSRWLDYKENNE